jgi:hypothetical protein
MKMLYECLERRETNARRVKVKAFWIKRDLAYGQNGKGAGTVSHSGPAYPE